MNAWPWPHFGPEEVLSSTGLWYLEKKRVLKVQGFAMDAMEDWREYAGVPILVNFGHHRKRGYRSAKENSLGGVKGVSDSPHTQGIAFDQTPRGIPTFDFFVAAVAWTYLSFLDGETGFGGLGYYHRKNFMHGDFRTLLGDYIVLWNGEDNHVGVLYFEEIADMEPSELPARLIQLLKLPKDLTIKEQYLLPDSWENSECLESDTS